MTYVVVWALAALREATRVEQAVDDPARVREAQDRIDLLLRRYPHDIGESRSPGYRVWYEDVLGVYYRIDDANLRVEMLAAGPSRRRCMLTFSAGAIRGR